MNNAFICDTQFQIINCLNIVYHNYNKNQNDIFIGEEFPDADIVIKNIKKSGLFHNVYRYVYPRNFDHRFKHKLNRVRELINPKKHVLSMIKDKIDLSEKRYDFIYISAPAHFMTLMVWSNPGADVIYFDDGTGSYSGNMLERLIDKKHQIAYRLLGRDYNALKPKQLFVNNIDFCNSSLTKDIQPLPRINDDAEFVNFCKKIFELEYNNPYSKCNFIYLGQPYFYNIEKSIQIENEISKTIIEHTQCVARFHPGQNCKEIPGFIIDKKRTAWELICVNEVHDSTVLIGRCSTAQLTPKIIFDKEPYIIFTYNLLGKLLKKEDKMRFDQLTKSLEEIYKDKSKIRKPATFDELDYDIRYCTRNNTVVNNELLIQ